jgi:hypothetical protein
MEYTQSSDKSQNTLGKVSLMVLFSALFGFGSLVGIVLLFPRLSMYFTAEVNWSFLEGYASVLSLAILIGGFTFVISEYNSKEKAKHLEKIAAEREKAKLDYDIYQAIFEMLTAPEQEAARRWILANITIPKDDEDINVWYTQTNKKIMSIQNRSKRVLPEGQEHVKLTLNCFDYIGFIASHYWHVEKDSLDWISAPIAKVWRRIGPYVICVRKLRGTTDYYISAEYIGELCVKWRKDKGLLDEIYAEKTP